MQRVNIPIALQGVKYTPSSLVQTLSTAMGMPLQCIGQSATGSVVLNGYNGGKLAFMPLAFQTGDFRANGVYPTGNG